MSENGTLQVNIRGLSDKQKLANRGTLRDETEHR